MKTIMKMLAAALLTASSVHGLAAAETVLRLDEAPVGELDPAKASDYADSILIFNVYDALVIPKQGQPGYAPHLAASWEVEGTAYTFKLRTNVKFQSGNPLTADDVVFSFERMKALGSGLSYLFENVDKVEAIDAATVRFTLKQPYSPFISALTRLPVVDKKLVLEHLGNGDGEMKDWGQGFLSANAAGTGAYKVVSHNPQEETVMSKNAGYFLGVPAKAPDTVRMRYGLEAATVRTLISQGEHDISSQWLPPEVLKSLAADGAQLLTERGTTGFYIKMNTAKPPFDDAECRLAVSYAFDYESGVKIVAINDKVSQGSPATGAIPVGMLGALPQDNVLKRDVEKAKEHLAKCKYRPEEMNVELSWIGEVPLEERFALLMQANFAEIGIKAEVKKLPWALFSEQVSKPENTPNISQLFVNTLTGDPDTLLYGMYHSSAAGTWQAPEYLKDAEVDALLDKGRAEQSDDGRAKIYQDLGKRLLTVTPSIFAQDQTAVFAASNRVSVPALTDPAKAFPLAGFGFNFRLMEMKE
ncbi:MULTISPECIES: ABC transporter substrate-binding protein [unclassified Ensifer]|uniref:ABC transporter substrate-binding protein n=1 Tax=unclassified Ensifer TaxID=2633371 RepID=UPI000813AF8C|nr:MULTISPECIES: ABC transporter substrate-binding protein [unclassified Ensifer]OCP25113.1 twin-arginine translocation pathway signal protein [Ensifer sp. LC54]OCP25224.1 twin-arginine translocation pathway signal protein [Ensifer sp. LC384]